MYNSDARSRDEGCIKWRCYSAIALSGASRDSYVPTGPKRRHVCESVEAKMESLLGECRSKPAGTAERSRWEDQQLKWYNGIVRDRTKAKKEREAQQLAQYKARTSATIRGSVRRVGQQREGRRSGSGTGGCGRRG